MIASAASLLAAYGVRGAVGGQLVEGHERGIGDRSVHLGRAGDQDAGIGPTLTGGGQQRGGTDHIHLQDLQWVLPRLPHVGQGGQMVDGVGSGGGHRPEQRHRIGDIDLVVDGDHLITLLSQVIGEPGADESSASGDQRAHDRSPYRFSWRNNGWLPWARATRAPLGIAIGLDMSIRTLLPGVGGGDLETRLSLPLALSAGSTA